MYDGLRPELRSREAYMNMQAPPHPGQVLREFCGIGPNLDHSVKGAAEMLGISGTRLTRIINGNAGISAELSLKIAKKFGGSPRLWLRMQMEHDLFQAEFRLRNCSTKSN